MWKPERFTRHILDGGDRGKIEFIIDRKQQTARIEVKGLKCSAEGPHLETTIQIARRMWYYYHLQGFREINPDLLIW